jgi:ribosomal protein S25
MAPKAQKSKEAKMIAAMSASKSKGKKKWSKGKVREKKNYRVVLTKVLFDKIMKEVPRKMKVITVYNLVENYKINGSLARRIIRELMKQAMIRPVATHSDHVIYTMSGKVTEEKSEAAPKKGKGGKPKKEEAADDMDESGDGEKPKASQKGKGGDKAAKAAPKAEEKAGDAAMSDEKPKKEKAEKPKGEKAKAEGKSDKPAGDKPAKAEKAKGEKSEKPKSEKPKAEKSEKPKGEKPKKEGKPKKE